MLKRESENLNLVRRVYASLDDDDADTLLSACADNVEWLYPETPGLPYTGRWQRREGVAAFLEAHDAAEETLELEAHEYLAGGNRVVVLGHFRAAAIPTKREWSIDFVHELVIQDGRIAIFRSYFDTAAAVRAHTP